MAINLGFIINSHIAPVIIRFCSKIIRKDPNILLVSAQKSMRWNNGFNVIVPNISDSHQLSYFSRNGFYIYRIYWKEQPNYYNAYGLINHHVSLKNQTVEAASEELIKAIRFIEAEKKFDRLPSYWAH